MRSVSLLRVDDLLTAATQARQELLASSRVLLLTAQSERHGLERFLGELCAAVTGVLERDLSWVKSPQGKPGLRVAGEPAGLEFNLSHSGARLLIGMSTRGPIGVDIEQHRPSQHWQKIARERFGLELTEKLESAARTDDLPPQRFFDYWSATEALIKCFGGGVFRDVSQTRVRFADSGHADVIAVPAHAGRAADYHVTRVDVGEGWSAWVSGTFLMTHPASKRYRIPRSSR